MAHPDIFTGMVAQFDTCAYNISCIIAHTNDGTIRMNRNFLRWGEKEKQEFLEHVLGGYPIPLIVIHGSVTNGGECVDGKNRLIRLHKYANGELLYMTNDGVKHNFTKLDNESQKKLLNKTMISVVSLHGPEWTDDRVRMYSRILDKTKYYDYYDTSSSDFDSDSDSDSDSDVDE